MEEWFISSVDIQEVLEMLLGSGYSAPINSNAVLSYLHVTNSMLG